MYYVTPELRTGYVLRISNRVLVRSFDRLNEASRFQENYFFPTMLLEKPGKSRSFILQRTFDSLQHKYYVVYFL